MIEAHDFYLKKDFKFCYPLKNAANLFIGNIALQKGVFCTNCKVLTPSYYGWCPGCGTAAAVYPEGSCIDNGIEEAAVFYSPLALGDFYALLCRLDYTDWSPELFQKLPAIVDETGREYPVGDFLAAVKKTYKQVVGPGHACEEEKATNHRKF